MTIPRTENPYPAEAPVRALPVGPSPEVSASRSICLVAYVFAVGCVNTEESGELPPTSPTIDCTALSVGGEPSEISLADPAVRSEPAGPTADGPYQWENATIKGGGFVSGIVFGSAAPNLIYARTDVGGAYRFDVTAQRWRAITDWVGAAESNLMGIESIATDPSEAGRVYLAAGTYLTAGDGLILSSADFGATWQRHAIGVPMGGNVNGRSMGERLAVDPRAPNVLYFASRNDGLLVSRDAAQTWEQVAGFPVMGSRDLGLSFVHFDVRDGQAGEPTSTIYVGAARLMPDDVEAASADGQDARNPEQALYYSRDAGETWQAVPGQPAEMMPHHAAQDSDGRLYLAYSDRPGPNDIRRGAVWRLDTQSGQWLDISPPKPPGQGGFAGVSVDAQRSGVVMVTTLDVWAPDLIFRSTSAGECWSTLNNVARDLRGAEWVKFGGAAPNATGWMGDIEIDPFHPSRALYITGQGIWQSDDVTSADAGERTNWFFHNDGLEETVALGLVSPPDGAPLLTAVGDIAGFRHDDFNVSPSSGMFDNPLFGNTTSIDFAERSPAQVVRVGTSGQGRRGAFSMDGGSTWAPFASEPVASLGEGVIAVAADGGSWVWDPRGTGLNVTRDSGQTWTPSTGLPMGGGGGGGGTTIAADRVNPLKFYARAGNAIFVSTDGGSSFVATGAEVPGGGARLRTVFGIEGDVWVSSGGGLWHSTDSGQTFMALAAVSAASAVGFGQAPPGGSYPALYLSGTQGDRAGLYRSDDGGSTFVAIDDSAHRFGFVGHITGDPRVYGRVYIGTGGRGVLYGDPR